LHKGAKSYLERKNTMFRKSWSPALTKLSISGLRGGLKHNFCYFVGISESVESDVLTNIMYVKLRNQKASQRTGEFPEGYEPFQASYAIARFCLKTMTIPVPRLKLRPEGWPNTVPTPRIITERQPACVLNPSGYTEAFHALGAEAEIFEIKHRIRRHAAESHAKLDLVLSLMAYRGDLPLCPDPTDRFEAYLCLRCLEFLRDLLALLDMPDASSKPTERGLPRAA
jgi:hypothetical protein